jgi:23S rRNA (cytosine1962-C5)-methyltransferase
MSEKSVVLKPRKEQSLLRRHPWVFSGAIKRTEGQPVTGDLVVVRANKGRILGHGHFSSNTSIAVRMLAFEEAFDESTWWIEKLKNALDMRRSLGLFTEDNSICRLVHAEGDGMSGLIIDYYDRVAVVQTHSKGMHLNLDCIQEGLKQSLPELCCVYNKSAKVLRKAGVVDAEDGVVFGEIPQDWNPVERGRKFHIDLEQGQKTGFFIDQRENRSLLGALAKDKRVLNVFSYTGGFSVSALQGDASYVASLDSSGRALELAEQAVSMNAFKGEHQCIEADALDYLKAGVADYDIVVLDPPAFAKSASARHAAVQGYKRINQRTLESIKPGGLLFTFSCSQAVDDRLFTHTVIAAAIQANRNVRILHRLHQPADHPVSAFHPEGAYLKGLVLRVD